MMTDKDYADAVREAHYWSNEYDKLKAINALLLENLKRIVDRTRENNYDEIFPSALNRAEAAIKLAEQ